MASLLEGELLDRRAVPTYYDVLPAIPLPDGEETLTWVSNIFIASDLSETRTSLTPYPAITVTYNFNLRCSIAKTWLASLPTAQNRWMLPYFPYLSQGTVANGNLTFDTNVHYPYDSFLLTFSYGRLRYYGISTASGNSSDVVIYGVAENPTGKVVVCPCFEAIMTDNVKFTDQGGVDGSLVSLTFRFTGGAEQAMTYHADTFDFINTVQRPVETEVGRRQATFAPKPAPVHTYSPIAYKENQVPKLSVEYWLTYLDDQQQPVSGDRSAYAFRGVLMKGLGAVTAGNYVVSDKLHRVQDDVVNIKYDNRIARGATVMREVAA